MQVLGLFFKYFMPSCLGLPAILYIINDKMKLNLTFLPELTNKMIILILCGALIYSFITAVIILRKNGRLINIHDSMFERYSGTNIPCAAGYDCSRQRIAIWRNLFVVVLYTLFLILLGWLLFIINLFHSNDLN